MLYIHPKRVRHATHTTNDNCAPTLSACVAVTSDPKHSGTSRRILRIQHTTSLVAFEHSIARGVQKIHHRIKRACAPHEFALSHSRVHDTFAGRLTRIA